MDSKPSAENDPSVAEMQHTVKRLGQQFEELGGIMHRRSEAGMQPFDWEPLVESYGKTRVWIDLLDEQLTALAKAADAKGSDRGDIRADVERLVALNGNIQNSLSALVRIAGNGYLRLLPDIVNHYLNSEQSDPQWGETWPEFEDLAREVIEELKRDKGESRRDSTFHDEVDYFLAKLRWELNWPQTRLAEVVGLSQPSVAARLGRIEQQIDEAIAVKHVTDLARTEGFSEIGFSNVSRTYREPRQRIDMARDGTHLRSEVFTYRGRDLGDQSLIRDVIRRLRELQATRRRRGNADQMFITVAVYQRAYGEFAFYPAEILAGYTSGDARFGDLPLESAAAMLHLTDPAKTPSEVLVRAIDDRGASDVGEEEVGKE